MATITGKTEFARRVQALGLTLVELAEKTGYSLQALRNISAGQNPLTKRLDAILKLLEAEKEKEKD